MLHSLLDLLRFRSIARAGISYVSVICLICSAVCLRRMWRRTVEPERQGWISGDAFGRGHAGPVTGRNARCQSCPPSLCCRTVLLVVTPTVVVRAGFGLLNVRGDCVKGLFQTSVIWKCLANASTRLLLIGKQHRLSAILICSCRTLKSVLLRRDVRWCLCTECITQ